MINRLALRILRLKACRTNNARAVQCIDILLGDRELLQIFSEYLQYSFYGSPIDLLKWIKENWKEILEAIIELIDLFSDPVDSIR